MDKHGKMAPDTNQTVRCGPLDTGTYIAVLTLRDLIQKNFCAATVGQGILRIRV